MPMRVYQVGGSVRDGLLGLPGEVDKVLMKDAEHAVEGTVDLLDGGMVEGFRDHAGNTGVDDGRGAAGLAHEDIAYKFFSHDRVFGKGWKKREWP